MNLSALLCEKFKLKALSLLCAAFLWLFVTMEGTDELELPLAVGFVNAPEGTVVRADSLPKLSVTVSGMRILLMRQKFRGAVARLDLAGALPGTVEFSALERYVRLESGLSPLRVSPRNVSIILEKTSPAGTR